MNSSSPLSPPSPVLEDHSSLSPPSPVLEDHSSLSPPSPVLKDHDDALRTGASSTTPGDASSNPARHPTSGHPEPRVWQSVKLYWPSILWAVVFSASLVMEGYDLALVPSLFAQPQFQKRFGELLPDGSYDISAGWKTGLVVGPMAGELVGLLLNGFLCDRYGYKMTMILAMGLMKGFIFLTFFAPNVEILFASQLLSGIPWGVFQAIAPSYTSDICHVSIRPYVTNFVNFCWLFGQLAASVVLRSFLGREDQWAFRIPFAIQWVFPPVIMVLAMFAPESPWFLLRKGRESAAKSSLRRLASRHYTMEEAERTLAYYIRTDEIEKAHSAGTSYLDCFKGADRRRTEIACLVWLAQSFVGSPLMGSSTYFYTQAGVATAMAFNLTLIGYAVGMVGTIISWFITGVVGRRKLYLGGCSTLCMLLLSIACSSFASTTAGKWSTSVLLVVYTLVYNITVGPTCYTLISEIPSTRLKAKTVVIARSAYNIGSVLVNILANYQLTPKATGGWGWSAKTGFFYFGTCLAMVIWQYYRLPEPKDREYAELDVMFEHRVDARKFAVTAVDVASGTILEERRSVRKRTTGTSIELKGIMKIIPRRSRGLAGTVTRTSQE